MSNTRVCPLCGKPNNCQAELPQTCWCNNVTVPKELIEQVPEQLKRKACICLNCIEQFNNEKDS